MSNVNTTPPETDSASRRPPFAIGDTVRVKAGVPDPDFRRRTLDGRIGQIVDRDESSAPARYLVQWDHTTLHGMARDRLDRTCVVVAIGVAEVLDFLSQGAVVFL